MGFIYKFGQGLVDSQLSTIVHKNKDRTLYQSNKLTAAVNSAETIVYYKYMYQTSNRNGVEYEVRKKVGGGIKNKIQYMSLLYGKEVL